MNNTSPHDAALELPRSLRRAYRSNNESHIKEEISKALEQGFSYEHIREDFEDWKSTMEMVE